MVNSPNGGGGRCRPKRLNVGCWNMRTLVESDGSIATGKVAEVLLLIGRLC